VAEQASYPRFRVGGVADSQFHCRQHPCRLRRGHIASCIARCNRTSELKAPEEVHLDFGSIANVRLKSLTSNFKVGVSCRGLDQDSSLKKVCTWRLPLLSVETLCIYGIPSWKPDRRDNVENSLWQELLQPFSAVKNLYLREEFARHTV
jgi:hypothetical protein